MISPVVHSRFGSRPLLEVPAMNVPGTSDMIVVGAPAQQVAVAPAAATIQQSVVPTVPAAAIVPTVPAAAQALPTVTAVVPTVSTLAANTITAIPTVQTQTVAPLNPFPSAVNPMVGSGLYNIQPTSFSAGAFPSGLQQYQLDARHHSAPSGPLQGRQYYYGPNGEIIFPPPYYPGVAHPFAGSAPNPYGGPPRHLVYPNRDPMPFDVSCELEFGRITHMDLRDSPESFRGIPDFIRLELLRTYGAESHTQVRIRYSHGEFHIYAGGGKKHVRKEHRHPRNSESDDDDSNVTDYGETDVDSYSQINPRGRARPRRIIHEKGWNRFR